MPMPWLQDVAAKANGIASVVGYVRAQLAAIDAEPVHVVGHDLGGVVLYWLARTEFRRAIKSMTMIAAPHPAAYLEATASPAFAHRVGYIDTILSTADDDRLRRELTAGITGMDAQVLGDITAALAATDFAPLRSVYAELRQAPRPGAWSAAPFDFPVAVIHAQEDRYLPADLMADSRARFGPGTWTFTLPGDSHYPHLTAPARCAEFLEDFWNAAES